MTANIAYIVNCTEHEFGQHPDGFYLYKTRDDAARHKLSFDMGSKEQYWTLGSPVPVQVVSDSVWEELQFKPFLCFNEHRRVNTYVEL